MTYDPQIPIVTESPSTSASPIQVNFDQFSKIFGAVVGGINYNHIGMNKSGQGNHARVIIQKQSVDPVVDQDLVNLYAKDYISQISTEPQLFAKIPKFLPTEQDTTQANNDPMQLTYNSVGTAGPVYYSFLPGGYLIYFGIVGPTINYTDTVTVSPAPKSLLVAIANPTTVEINSTHRPLKICTNITSSTTFNVKVGLSAGSFGYTWFAIGVA